MVFLKAPLISSAVIDARTKIEEELVRAQNAVINLKRQLNELSIATYFPDEILAEILTQYVHNHERDGMENSVVNRAAQVGERYFPTYTHPYLWIKITHVCYHWRLIALNQPRLWSHIYFTRQDCVEEMLVRSKQTPLTFIADIIHLRRYEADSISLIRRIMRELPRISRIYMQLFPSLPLYSFLQTYQYSRAQMLRTFVFPCFIGPTSVTAPLHDLDFPNLEEVEVNITFFSIDNTLFRPNLRRLTLTAVPGQPVPVPAPFPTLEDVFTVLRKLPLLEHVALQYVSPGSIPSLTSLTTSLGIVTLSHLQHLKLQISISSACTILLNHLRFPATAIIDIYCQSSDNWTRELPELISAVALKRDALQFDYSPRPFQSLSLDTTATQTLSLRGWSSVLPAEMLAQQYLIPKPDLSITLDVINVDEPMDTSLSMVAMAACEVLPLSQVSALYVGTPRVCHNLEEQWLTSFSQMAGLRALRVCGGVADVLPRILLAGRDLSGGQGLGTRAYVFGELRGLILEGVVLKDTVVSDEVQSLHLYEHLLTSLEARRDNHAGMTEISITEGIRFNGKDLEMLKRVVPRAIWDGVEHGFGGNDDERDDDDEEEVFESDSD